MERSTSTTTTLEGRGWREVVDVLLISQKVLGIPMYSTSRRSTYIFFSRKLALVSVGE